MVGQGPNEEGIGFTTMNEELWIMIRSKGIASRGSQRILAWSTITGRGSSMIDGRSMIQQN
jgi:hypothetical protein